jgi:hypothetical protein
VPLSALPLLDASLPSTDMQALLLDESALALGELMGVGLDERIEVGLGREEPNSVSGCSTTPLYLNIGRSCHTASSSSPHAHAL